MNTPKTTRDYRKVLLREMKQLEAGNSSVHKAKAMAQLGNSITQSMIAEAQVMRLQQAAGLKPANFGDTPICDDE